MEFPCVFETLPAAATEAKQYFGDSLTVGDVNGDGYDDLLASVAGYNNAQGKVYLYFGGRNMDNNADKVFIGEAAGNHFGNMAGTLGDINGDGYYDVIIGARGYSTNGYSSSGDGWGDGRVYIYYGAANMDTIADIILEGEVGQRGGFGVDVRASDIDNDGYDDLLVGAMAYDHERGRVYLFWGGNPMDTSPDMIFEGEADGDNSLSI